jgi:hypothetical protein
MSNEEAAPSTTNAPASPRAEQPRSISAFVGAVEPAVCTWKRTPTPAVIVVGKTTRQPIRVAVFVSKILIGVVESTVTEFRFATLLYAMFETFT